MDKYFARNFRYIYPLKMEQKKQQKELSCHGHLHAIWQIRIKKLPYKTN